MSTKKETNKQLREVIVILRQAVKDGYRDVGHNIEEYEGDLSKDEEALFTITIQMSQKSKVT